MPLTINDIIGIGRGAAEGYRGGGGIGGAIAGGLGNVPWGSLFPPGSGGSTEWTQGPGGTWRPSIPINSGGSNAAPIRDQTMARLVGMGGQSLGPWQVRLPTGRCIQVTPTGGLQDMQCPGGGFGGGGAGGSWGDGNGPNDNPPPFPAPGFPMPAPGGSGSCTPAPYGMGLSIVESPTYEARVASRPGYVTVTLPFAIGSYGCGQKVQMLKEVARKFGLWKPRAKPVLTAGDMKALRKAERVENKLKTLTTRHTDFRVVKKR